MTIIGVSLPSEQREVSPPLEDPGPAKLTDSILDLIESRDRILLFSLQIKILILLKSNLFVKAKVLFL